MPNIGPMELILLGILAVAIFGAAKLPEIGRSLGRATRDFKDSVDGTGISGALDDVGGVRGAMKPTNLAKAALPASVKEVTSGVTDMKETFTDPLGTKKKEKEDAEAEAAPDKPAAADPPPPAREQPVAAAPAPVAPAPTAAPPA